MGVVLAMLAGCGDAPEGAAGEAVTAEAVTAEATGSVENARPVEASLYGLPYRLTDADGREVGLDVHRGHPTIVAMFYASCTQACPLMIGKVQSILAGLDPATRADTRVLLVSMDPEHDTPEALRAAGERYHVGSPEWELTRPDPHDLRPIAALLDVRYAAQADGQLSHTSPVTLLDAEGRIVLRQGAVSDPNEPVVKEIAALAAR